MNAKETHAQQPPKPHGRLGQRLWRLTGILLLSICLPARPAETLGDLDQDTRNRIYSTLNISPSTALTTLLSDLNLPFSLPGQPPPTPAGGGSQPAGSQPAMCLPCTPYHGGLLCWNGKANTCYGCTEPMVTWQVTEPSLNLWLSDTPFQYNASRGGRVNFHIYYKNALGSQGTIDNTNKVVFSVGNKWHTPWRSYIEPVPGQSTNSWLYLGDGTAILYTSNKADYFTRATLTQDAGTNVLTFATGARAIYGYQATIGGKTLYFVSRNEDQNGNALMFTYLLTNNTIRLDSVTDPDKRTTTFEYVSAGGYSNLISKVIGPHNLTNILQYDSSGRLTNSIDILGLSSKILYDADNVTAVITPYGTNTFTYFSNTNLFRAIKVTEQGIRNNFFLYDAEVEAGKVPSSYSSYRPSTTNSSYFAVSNAFDDANSHLRNTFYWNPRQYERLSSLIRTNLDNSSFNVSNLSSGDYLAARQLHWLKAAGGSTVGRTISLRRDGSPDGSLQGQTHWYDYPNKDGGFADREGTSSLHCLSATKLPNGEARFSCVDRNLLGYMTNKASTYTETNGACKLRTNQYFYAANNVDLVRKVQILGGTSRQVMSNIFNAYHQILTNYDALSQITAVTYDGNHQALTRSSPGGLTRSNVYNSTGTWSNFLTSSTLVEIGATDSFTWSNGYVLSRTDPRGLTMTYKRDTFGRRTKVTFPDGTYETRVYDRFDLTQVANRLSQTNQYIYNGFRQRTQAINPRGATASYNYCNCGALDSAVDPNGKTTLFSYDLLGRRCVTTYPQSGSITNNYDLLGQLTNSIDSLGTSITNCFNNQGLLCIVNNSFGVQKCTTYDIEDHAVEAIDANSITNRDSYDELRRLVKRTDGANATETLVYSSLGLIARTNQLGAARWYAYDPAGRKIAETNANGEVTLFTYNAAGDLIQLRDGNGKETSWGYDQYGRVTSKTNANGVEIFHYKYDAGGRMTNRWSLAKGNTFHSYDSAGNVTNIDYSGSPDISMQYDANNRLTNMVDAVGTTRFTYTDFGALLSEDGPWGSDTITYSYTTNRLRSKLSLQQQSASPWEQTYGYDSADRLTSTTSPAAGTFAYTYDRNAHQQVARLSLPNSANITNAFDALGRMTGTYLKNSSGTPFNSHTYLYDDASRVTRQTRTDGSYVDYSYGATDQLNTATGKEAGGTTNRWHEQFGYAYDAAANLTNHTNDGLTQAFNVDSLNQLISLSRSGKQTVSGTTWGPATNVTVADNGGSPVAALRYADNTFARTNITLLDGTNTFTAVAQDSLGRSDASTSTAHLPATASFGYDGNGNLTTNGTRIFEYDDENQLIRITESNAWKSEFTYDGKMRRRIRKEYLWSGSAWSLTNEVRYIYDGNLVIQERDCLNLPVVSYTRGRDLRGSLEAAGGIGGLLARTDNQANTTAFYHGDRVGNVTMLINSGQVRVAKYVYDPFGAVAASTGPLRNANTLQFSSMEVHQPSGLSCFKFRFLDCSTKRWLTRDPLGDAAFARSAIVTSRGATIERNLYAFVLNDPVNHSDYFGLAPVPAGTCANASPLKSDSAECNKYGNSTYMGAGQACFCSCAPDDSWSQFVRGCLRCMADSGYSTTDAHPYCYGLADSKYPNTKPRCALIWCFSLCSVPADGGTATGGT